jgi:oligopeptide transport system substrate-binding protein
VLVDVLHADRILPAVLLRPRRARSAVVLAALFLACLVVGPAPEPAAAAGPLRFLAGPPGTLDPAFIADQSDVQLLLQLYAGLTRLDEHGQPYASLAQGWEISDDELTYTFTLRDGLRFSDGTPLNAGDVRRSWLRLLDPAVGSLAPDVLSIVAGADERRAGSASEDEVGITAPDASTLVVRLRHPAAYFPAITATPTTFVVPPAADGSPDWQTVDGFVGSGPYVADRVDGADLVLRANEEYVAGPPPIDEVRFVGDLQTDPVSAFADGSLDLVGIGAFDAGWIAYDRTLGVSLHRGAASTIQFFGFDTTQPPFDDARVRRAFLLALDRQRLVELNQGTAATPASSIVPPAVQPAGWPTELEHDEQEAARLLDEAGYEDRGELGTVTVNGTGLDVEPAVATWREVLGVDVAIENMSFTDYLAQLDTGVAAPIYTINWVIDYPSPQALYGLLLAPTAASNYGRWQDDEFAALLDEAASEGDPVRQARAYAAVDARVDAEAPVIPWAYGETWWLTRDSLNGLGDLTLGLIDMGRISWDG